MVSTGVDIRQGRPGNLFCLFMTSESEVDCCPSMLESFLLDNDSVTNITGIVTGMSRRYIFHGIVYSENDQIFTALDFIFPML